MASRLVHSTPERAVQFQAMPCVVFLGKIFNSRSVSLAQEYKWLPDNCFENRTNYGGVTCDVLASRPGDVEILLVSCCRNPFPLMQTGINIVVDYSSRGANA